MNSILRLLLVAALVFPIGAIAFPIVTPENIGIDKSGATGLGDVFRENDIMVVYWDNSVLGDNNTDVTDLFQVSFDLSVIGNSGQLVPDQVIGGIFSYAYTFTSGGFSGPASGLYFNVTVTGGDSSVTGPVASLTTFDVDFNAAPVPIPAAFWLFGSALGLLGWMKRRAA